jgi:hypothetical protein
VSNPPTGFVAPDALGLLTVTAGSVVDRSVVVRKPATVKISTARPDGRALTGACYHLTLPDGYAPVDGCATSTSPLVLAGVQGTLTVTQTAAPAGYAIAAPQTVTVAGSSAKVAFTNSPAG